MLNAFLLKINFLTLIKRYTLVAVVLLGLLACGGGGKSTTPVEKVGSVIDKRLLGTWFKSCGPGDLKGPEPIYDIVETVFQDQKVVSIIKNYQDKNCINPYPNAARVKIEAKYKVGDEVITGRGLKAKQIDSSFAKQVEGSSVDVIVTEYGIYYIDEEKLYFDKDNGVDPVTPELRPTKLDLERIFVKQ